jgi:TrmH family RNA methyltransferase
MISKAKIKYIRSLEQKKSRKEEGVYVAEGPKVVGDLLQFFSPKIIVATEEGLSKYSFNSKTEVIEVSDIELKKVSFLQHPQQILAVFPQLKEMNDPILSHLPTEQLVLALDDVQDPGNLGTIIRIADWFGIENIICSNNTADVYNPKVIQATMGSIARVKIHYTNLYKYIKELKVGIPIYGALLNGENIYKQTLSHNGLVIMGNEGNGISPEIAKMINHKLFIPNYPAGHPTADSLNVAIATAITCSEFRRNGN